MVQTICDFETTIWRTNSRHDWAVHLYALKEHWSHYIIFSSESFCVTFFCVVLSTLKEQHLNTVVVIATFRLHPVFFLSFLPSFFSKQTRWIYFFCRPGRARWQQSDFVYRMRQSCRWLQQRDRSCFALRESGEKHKKTKWWEQVFNWAKHIEFRRAYLCSIFLSHKNSCRSFCQFMIFHVKMLLLRGVRFWLHRTYRLYFLQ